MNPYHSFTTMWLCCFIVQNRVQTSVVWGIFKEGAVSWFLLDARPCLAEMLTYLSSQLPNISLFFKSTPLIASQKLDSESEKMFMVASLPQAMRLKIFTALLFSTWKSAFQNWVMTLRVSLSSPDVQYLILSMVLMGMCPKACEVSLIGTFSSHSSLGLLMSSLVVNITFSGKYMPNWCSLRCSEVIEARDSLEDSNVQFQAELQEGVSNIVYFYIIQYNHQSLARSPFSTVSVKQHDLRSG